MNTTWIPMHHRHNDRMTGGDDNVVTRQPNWWWDAKLVKHSNHRENKCQWHITLCASTPHSLFTNSVSRKERKRQRPVIILPRRRWCLRINRRMIPTNLGENMPTETTTVNPMHPCITDDNSICHNQPWHTAQEWKMQISNQERFWLIRQIYTLFNIGLISTINPIEEPKITDRASIRMLSLTSSHFSWKKRDSTKRKKALSPRRGDTVFYQLHVARATNLKTCDHVVTQMNLSRIAT